MNNFNGYQLISKIILHEDSYDYAKYKVGQSTLRSRQPIGIQSARQSIESLKIDKAMFDALPPHMKEEQLARARRVMKLKKAGKFAAAAALLAAIYLTIRRYKKRKAENAKNRSS